MEAMAAERLVLAPDITGIPELVADGKTGFLYRPNSMEDFLHKLEFLLHNGSSLKAIKRAARLHVQTNFDRSRNLNTFATNFLHRLNGKDLAVLGVVRADGRTGRSARDRRDQDHEQSRDQSCPANCVTSTGSHLSSFSRMFSKHPPGRMVARRCAKCPLR